MSEIQTKALVAKSTITAGNTLAVNGKLNPAQADAFIDFVVDETVLTNIVRVVRFRNGTLDIDKIGLGSRAAMPKAEAIDPGLRRGVTTSKVSLTPVVIIVPIDISDEAIEENLEGDGFTAHVLSMYAKRLANDLEEIALHGNTDGLLTTEDITIPGGDSSLIVVDNYLKLFDGYLKLAEGGNIVDAAGAPLSAGLFRQAKSAMPTKFRRDNSQLKWLVPTDLVDLWRERVSSRATTAGDLALQGANLAPFGIEMIPMPLFEFYPQEVVTDQISGAGATIQLPDAPILAGSVVIILDSDAGQIGVTPFVEGVDYSVDSVNGIITDLSASIPATTDLRISYRAFPQMLLTTVNNLIWGIGRDIRMERARNIHRGVDQYVTTVKFAVQIEELTAVVKVKNISDAL